MELTIYNFSEIRRKPMICQEKRCKPIRYKLTTLKGNRQTIDSLTSKMKTDNLSLHHIRSILVLFEKGANRQHTNSKRLGKNDKL